MRVKNFNVPYIYFIYCVYVWGTPMPQGARECRGKTFGSQIFLSTKDLVDSRDQT